MTLCSVRVWHLACRTSTNVETFRLYVWQRQEGLAERLAFYAELAHRRIRWKSYLKSQQSEESCIRS